MGKKNESMKNELQLAKLSSPDSPLNLKDTSKASYPEGSSKGA